MDDDLTKKTRRVQVGLSKCGVLSIGTPFKIRRSSVEQFQVNLQKCFFEQCGRVLDVEGKGCFLNVRDCLFSHNELCFNFRNSEGNEKGQSEGSGPKASPPSVLIKGCTFRYNLHVLSASNFLFPISFEKNKVEYQLGKGIVASDCSELSIVENLFEGNFDWRLFGSLNSKLSSSEKVKASVRLAQQLLLDDKKTLIKLDKSCAEVLRNCFLNNCGTLIRVKQSPKAFGSSLNIFKNEASRRSPIGRKARDFKLESKVINSKQGGPPPQPVRKKSGFSSFRKLKSEKSSIFQSKLNESDQVAIDPQRLKKKLPSEKLFQLKGKLRKKIKGRKSKTKDFKKSQPNFSYLSILEKQSNFADSR